MDSAEASARTLEAAIAAAADQLGLRRDQVDVEVLQEAVPSTFGTIGQPARVRVTVREPSSNGSTLDDIEPQVVPTATIPTATLRPAVPRERPPMVQDAEAIAADTEIAGDFVEGFLDALDLDGDINTWVDGNGGNVNVEGPDLELLIGPDGETLIALQELTRLAVLRQTQRRVRIMVDVDGYRARRQEELTAMSKATAERVIQTGRPERLRPMTPYERKIVHDAVAMVDGANTESVGEEPERSVIIRPAVS
ncbi:MAG TPA: RNA-binding cell elongation regulator Jag/EloR [Actinomycetes bacterium]|nr:RNA-binding cell elongation regulator Jag/EloR [Actinomycetes bacterium]